MADAERIYDGNGVLNVTILDSSPYGYDVPTGAGKNDCDRNGSFGDVVDDNDCDNNGVADVTLTALSLQELTGENYVANQTAAGFRTARSKPRVR